MTPEQAAAVETVMEEYRTSLRPLTITFSIIAGHFRRAANLPNEVNNEIRNAFDHLAIMLASDQRETVATNARQALWHLLIARCDLLRVASDIVRMALEAAVQQLEQQGGTPDPRLAAQIAALAARAAALRAEMAQTSQPLPIDDPDGNRRKMAAQNMLLERYLAIYQQSDAYGIAPAKLHTPTVRPFSDEQARVAANLRQHYDAWLLGERRLATLAHDMRWQTADGTEGLWRQARRNGAWEHLGPHGPETVGVLTAFRAEQAEWSARRHDTMRRLQEVAALYRLLRLPLLAGEAAAVLREFDRRGILGTQVLVIGTNAMPAYVLEAAGFLADAPDETEDFDVAWAATQPPDDEAPLWSALKAVDSTYTVNTERNWQALNRGGYPVEFLVAPSRAGTIVGRDRPRPLLSDSQEWLLNGRRVDHVVVGRDGSPARIVAPDPRWFALHKLWLCAQESRDPLKRDKDNRQGTSLMNAIEEAMPHYHLDAAFQAELPEPLVLVFRAWRATRPEAPPLPAW
ncbi:MAG TPA: GSU2403 family nucleotidyltransferase fold protein [Acetobacteraceae bacterium]|nr:GSU2403 family nucleotidyltransferase fold protein [Acetobacteraceae bacterium]